jgi:hypothetical protein
MTDRTFKTSEVLAAIHAFPGLLAASDKSGVIEAFDKLREISPKMAGIDFSTSHLGWCELSGSLKPVLRKYFSALAAEPFPDKEYWSNPETLDPEKIARLGDWVHKMEEKYGATQEVPNLRVEINRSIARKILANP